VETRRVVMTSALMLAAVALGYATGAWAARGGSNEVVPASDVKWGPLDPKNPDGPQVATVWGDMKKGPVGFLLKTPGKFDFPRHAHTPDYYAVVVKGEWKHTFAAGSDAPPLAPGSHWHQPGKQMHGDACVSADECIVLVYERGKPDFIPEKAPGK
jgi:hypothetical protein